MAENREDSIPYILKPTAINLLLFICLHIHSFHKAFFIVPWLPETKVGRGLSVTSIHGLFPGGRIAGHWSSVAIKEEDLVPAPSLFFYGDGSLPKGVLHDSSNSTFQASTPQTPLLLDTVLGLGCRRGLRTVLHGLFLLKLL